MDSGFVPSIWSGRLPGLSGLSCCVSACSGPPTTRFQIIDFAARAISKESEYGSFARVLVKLTDGGKSQIRKELGEKSLFLGDVSGVNLGNDRNSGGIRRIGFSLIEDVKPLKARKLYEGGR